MSYQEKTSIWIQLCVGSEKNAAIPIYSKCKYDDDYIIHALKEEVKEKSKEELSSHCSAGRLQVSAAGTTSVPIPGCTEPLRPGDPVPTGTNGSSATQCCRSSTAAAATART